MIRFGLTYTLIFLVGFVNAQSNKQITENRINTLFAAYNTVGSDAEADLLSDSIATTIIDYFHVTDSFAPQFDIKYVGTSISPDKRLAVYTWNYPKRGGNLGYGSVFQFRPTTKHKFVQITAKDNSKFIPKWPVLDNEWYGALYYDVIPDTTKVNRFILLGWQSRGGKVARKVVDVVQFSKTHALFGAPLFVQNEDTLNRVVLEYNARTVLSLNYESSEKRILFNQIEAVEPEKEGKAEYSGASERYDALQREGECWRWVKDVEVYLEEDHRIYSKPLPMGI